MVNEKLLSPATERVDKMTFEEWLTDLSARSLSSAEETRNIAPDSWGSGFDTGYSDALIHVVQQWKAHHSPQATENPHG